MNISYNALHCRSSWSYDDKKPGWPAPSLGPRPPHTQLSQGCPTLLHLLATLHCIIRTPGLTYKAEQGTLLHFSLSNTSMLHRSLLSAQSVQDISVFSCPTIKTPLTCSANAVLHCPERPGISFDFHRNSLRHCYFHFLFPVIMIVATWWLDKTLTFELIDKAFLFSEQYRNRINFHFHSYIWSLGDISLQELTISKLGNCILIKC